MVYKNILKLILSENNHQAKLMIKEALTLKSNVQIDEMIRTSGIEIMESIFTD